MKFKSKVFVIALMMLLLLCVSCVSASENETFLSNDGGEVLTLNEDEILLDSQENEVMSRTEEDMLSAQSFDKLQEFIDNTEEGGTLNLVYDFNSNSGDTTTIPISKSITIEGNGHYITGSGEHGILKIDDDKLNHAISVTLKNIKFSGGVANGGAISVDSDNYKVDLTIIDCEFTENKGHIYGGAILYDPGTEDSSLTISGSSFINNQATYKSFFTTAVGGAIAARNGVVKVEGCSFAGNSATRSGGAIYSLCEVTIDNCYFYLNHAPDDGGAIYSKGTLKWGENPSEFKENYVDTDNKIEANKGGAIYAETIENTVKGTFIGNKAWYGGAIYVNSKGHVNVESSKFEGNTAKKSSGSSGCGAAIYMDSSSALLTLRYNIFINNQAYDDYGVYNCGKYESVEYNWWGTNNPDFNQPYLVEWHRIGSNDKHSDGHPLKIVLSSDKDKIMPSDNAILTLKFMADGNLDLTDRLNGFDVAFKSNKAASFKSVGDSKTSAYFMPSEQGDHLISAQVNDQAATTHVWVMGDFEVLQELINRASEVLKLERDYTYTVGVDKITEGLLINKPLTIDGNEHTINAMAMSRIFNIASDDVVINNIELKHGKASSGGAILLNNANNFIISNSEIYNSDANMGAAIFSSEGNNAQILNCTFESDISRSNGGAVYIATPNSKIDNSEFNKNIAEYGGAIYVSSEASNLIMSNCKFDENSANYYGGAIVWNGTAGRIENSTFRLNKANSRSFVVDNEGYYLIGTFKGYEHYVNAIYSDMDLSFSNITYEDHGQWKNTDNPIKSYLMVNETISMVVYDAYGGHVVKQVSFKTNESGQIKFETYELEDGNYTYWMTNPNSDYYRAKTIVGRFNVTNDAYIGSSVKITTENGKEFEYDNIKIDFTFENKTEFRVLVRNQDCTKVIYDQKYSRDSDDYFDYNLLPSNEYYNITVYNLGNSTCKPSHDSIVFKVKKDKSYIHIESSPTNITYSSNASISFKGEANCSSYKITIYDETNDVVYSEDIRAENITGSVNIPLLNVGEYNFTITNLGNEFKSENSTSGSFRVLKATTNFNVTVNNSSFNNETNVTVNAEIDGTYTVIINSTVETRITIEVVNGTGMSKVKLNAGQYSANVTFEHENYKNNATNTTFTIDKAKSHVGIEDFGDMIINQNRTIHFTDVYITKFNVTIYYEGNVIVSSENTTSLEYTIPKLANTGNYNITVTNLGNENILGSQASYIFHVDSTNNVEIIVDDEYYGRELLVIVIAEADGYYTVDINGTELTIEVVDGIGFDDTLQLPAGDYYANVTYDNPDYTNNITNTTFTIFKAESNLQIYEIGNVTYGADVVVRFYDDYPTTFYIEVVDPNGATVMNATFEYEDKNPEMSVIFSGLDVGEYAVIVYNNGDENVEGFVNAIDFNVTELQGSIVASDMTRVYNSGMDFTAKLVDNNGTGIANTTVTFVIKGKEYTAVTDANGVAIINPKLAVGTYKVEIVNPYNGVKTTKTLKIVSRITGNKNVKTYYGKNYKYRLRIIGDNGKTVGAGVSVKVTINGKAKTLKTDKNGYITVKFTKKYLPKTYTVKAEYKGIKVSNKIKVKKVLKLKKVKVKRSAKKLVLKATLKEGKKALKGKKVVFKFKGKKYKAKTNKKGVAKVKVKKNVLKKLKKGKKVKYQVTYLKHTVKRTAKVKK